MSRWGRFNALWSEKFFLDSCIHTLPGALGELGVLPLIFIFKSRRKKELRSEARKSGWSFLFGFLSKISKLRSGTKKVSKFRRKFYLVKSCSIWFILWHFLNKVSGKNMWKFHQNRITFYYIKFCSKNFSTNNSDTFFKKNCEEKKSKILTVIFLATFY